MVDENSEEQVDEGTNGAGEDGARADDADEPVETPPDPVAEAKAEAVKLKDQLLRTAADFDNFRKRSRREVNDAEIRGREELLKDLLPVFDKGHVAIVTDSASDLPPEVAATAALTALSYGELLPLSCKEDEAGRERNRRVDVWLRMPDSRTILR